MRVKPEPLILKIPSPKITVTSAIIPLLNAKAPAIGRGFFVRTALNA